MDPDKCLADARAFTATATACEADEKHDDAETLHAQAGRWYADLDEWLSKGGFPPDAWAGRERELTAQNDKLVAFVRRVADREPGHTSLNRQEAIRDEARRLLDRHTWDTNPNV